MFMWEEIKTLRTKYPKITDPWINILTQSCCRLVTLPWSSQYQDALQCWHSLLWLDHNKFVASCQQAWCKLIVRTFYPQVWCKLFKKFATRQQISSCIKSDFNRIDTNWWSQQAWCNLMTNLHQAGEIRDLA